MKVETRLIQEANLRAERADMDNRQPWALKAELQGWKQLFNQKYYDRTMVGVLIMVFQRMSGLSNLTCRNLHGVR